MSKLFFYEAYHFDGDLDLYTLVKEFLQVLNKRKISIAMRPDHGHQMPDDLKKKTYLSYSAMGR